MESKIQSEMESGIIRGFRLRARRAHYHETVALSPMVVGRDYRILSLNFRP